MIGDLKRFYRSFRIKASAGQQFNSSEKQPEEKVPIPGTLDEIKAQIDSAFSHDKDLILKPIDGNIILMALIDELTDKNRLTQYIIPQIVSAAKEASADPAKKNKEFFLKKLDCAFPVDVIDDFTICLDSIMSGGTMFFIDGVAEALCVEIPKWEKRSIDEPKTDNVVRGPREGFTETISINKSLIRRKLKDPHLVFEDIKVGRITQTQVSICYLSNIANDKVIEEVRKRIANIQTDSILESGNIEEYIEDSPFSIFPTIGNSERPDTVAGKLLEGRIAIFCDGTPFVLTVPHLFVEHLQNSEDYYTRWVYTPLLRFLRIIAFLAGTSLPAYYVALVCFHQDVIPFKLLLTIASSSSQIPFPPFIEMLIMIITFELIREGGIRIPRSLGQAVSIVGALIIGQAAVQSGLVSTPVVIMVAATAISSFVLSRMESAMFIIRVSLLIFANIAGFLGILLGSLAFYIYACSLKSFGIPYLAPIAPLYGQDLKDIFIRMPIWTMLRKPESIMARFVNENSSK